MSSSNERRGCSASNEMRNGLTLSQHYEVDALERRGATLLFVRDGNCSDALAVLRSHEGLTTVDFDGEVEFQPPLTLR